MAKYSLKQIMEPGFQLPSDYNDLVSVYRVLAKAADQRLVRLESYAHDPFMGDALKWAYAKAQRDIEQWSGEEAKRFNTAPPAKKQSLIAKIKDIESFIESPSSTKKGIINTYKKRADTINKKYGTNFTWQNIGNFFESDFFSDLDSKYDSDTVVRAIGSIKSSIKEKSKINKMQKEINKPLRDQKVVRINNDAILQKVIDDITANYSEEVQAYLK